MSFAVSLWSKGGFHAWKGSISVGPLQCSTLSPGPADSPRLGVVPQVLPEPGPGLPPPPARLLLPPLLLPPQPLLHQVEVVLLRLETLPSTYQYRIQSIGYRVQSTLDPSSKHIETIYPSLSGLTPKTQIPLFRTPSRRFFWFIKMPKSIIFDFF